MIHVDWRHFFDGLDEEQHPQQAHAASQTAAAGSESAVEAGQTDLGTVSSWRGVEATAESTDTASYEPSGEPRAFDEGTDVSLGEGTMLAVPEAKDLGRLGHGDERDDSGPFEGTSVGSMDGIMTDLYDSWGGPVAHAAVKPAPALDDAPAMPLENEAPPDRVMRHPRVTGFGEPAWHGTVMVGKHRWSGWLMRTKDGWVVAYSPMDDVQLVWLNRKPIRQRG